MEITLKKKKWDSTKLEKAVLQFKYMFVQYHHK